MVKAFDLPFISEYGRNRRQLCFLIMYQVGQLLDQLKEETRAEHIKVSAFKRQNNLQWLFIYYIGTQHVGIWNGKF